MKIKSFLQVSIGDIAVGADVNDPLGTVIWKGNWQDAKEKYPCLLGEYQDNLEEFDIEDDVMDEFVLVKFPSGTQPDEVLMTYNFDPCSAVVLEK